MQRNCHGVVSLRLDIVAGPSGEASATARPSRSSNETRIVIIADVINRDYNTWAQTSSAGHARCRCRGLTPGERR